MMFQQGGGGKSPDFRSGQSLDLIEKGIHPLRIATGFEKACEVGDKALRVGKVVLCVCFLLNEMV